MLKGSETDSLFFRFKVFVCLNGNIDCGVLSSADAKLDRILVKNEQFQRNSFSFNRKFVNNVSF